MTYIPDIHAVTYSLEIAELAVMKRDIQIGIIKPVLSEREAIRTYGRDVRKWVSAGLILPVKDGNRNSKKRYDRLQLEAISKQANRGL